MDEDLTKDLSRLLEEYHDYRAEWRAIGCSLNISQGDLNAIEKDYPRNCGDCFRAVLLQWLRNENRQETELEQAVEKVKLTYAQDHGELQPKVEMTITIHAQDNGELQQKEEKSIKRWLLAPIIIAVIAILLSLFLSTRFPTGTVPGPSNYNAYSLFNTTIQTLKELYREHRVMEFNVVDDVPFLNVSLRRNDDSVIEFWQLFHDIDTEYKNLQESSTKGKMRVLITGHPGGGKTTLLRYLANQWGEGNVLESCQILFLIHLDQLSQSMEKSPRSLKQLLLNSAYEDFKNIAQLMEEIADKQGAGVCFLLDSYDGWKFNHEKDFVHKLFFEGTLHHSLCILTTRSRSHEKSKQSISHNFTLVGFNQTHLDEYLHNLTTDRQTISFIKKSWKDYNTKELCVIPLNMMMLIYIAKCGEIPLIHTRTQLYIAFMNVITEHFFEDRPNWNWNSYDLKQCIQHRESNVHKDELCAAFHNLTYVAHEAVFYNKVPEISKTTRHNIAKLSLVRVVKVKSTSDRVNYIFSHDTFAEFYAAIYLLNLPPEHLLYLFVKGQHGFITLKTHSVWAFYFGLLGEQYSANTSISAVLRQFSLFDTTYSSTCKQPPVEVIQFIPEIGWTGEKLNHLLESAELMQNYTMCIEKIYTVLDSLRFILNHATVHTLKIIQAPDTMMIFDKGNRHGLDFQTIETALNPRCWGDDAFTNYDDKDTIKPLSNQSLTHFHVIRNYYKPMLYASEDTLQCLMKIGVNLHSLHVYLRNMSPLSQQNILALINDHTPHLQTLRLITEDDLPTTASLNQLQSTIKLELVIIFPHRSNTPLHRPQLSLLPLEKLNNLSRIESLTIIIFSRQDQYPSLEPNNTVILGKLTGLKHLSIQVKYNYDYFLCSNIVDQLLGSLKSKVIETLEIDGCYLGRQVMIQNNLSKLLPPTIQHISLTRWMLFDRDMPLLAESLKEMHNLISLSLHSNMITGFGLRSLVDGLKSLKHFTTLDLSLNHIQLANSISEMLVDRLTSPDLSWNPFCVNCGLETLVKLTYLRDLKLSGCQITAEALDVLSNLNLNSLDLSYNPVLNNMDGLRLLGRFKTVRQLDIRGIESFHGEILMNMLKNLTHLQILKLCDYDRHVYSEWSTNSIMSSEWSIDLARKVIDLPELQSLWAQCLYPPYWRYGF